jgi:hypothetical protein
MKVFSILLTAGTIDGVPHFGFMLQLYCNLPLITDKPNMCMATAQYQNKNNPRQLPIQQKSRTAHSLNTQLVLLMMAN